MSSVPEIPAGAPRRSTHRARTALVLASAVFALVAAELTAGRVYPFFERAPVPSDLRGRPICGTVFDFDPHTGWWPKPNLDCVATGERAVPVRTNGAGFNADHDFGPKAGRIRIGFLGDSLTFGDLVAPDDTYVSILERSLPGIETVNFGLDGGGPDQALLALRHKAAALELDALVLAFTPENIERILMRERAGRPKPYFTLDYGELRLHNHPVPFSPAPEQLPDGRSRYALGASPLRRSALWQLLLAGIRPVALRAGLYRPYAELYDGAAGALLERILAEFEREAGDRVLIFAPLPTYHYIEYDLAPDYERVYETASAAAGGTYVDVLAAFRRLTPAQRRAARFRFDQHYTPLAHRVVADALLPAVTAARDQILARRTP